MRVYDGVALGIERHGAVGRPVARVARRASRVEFASSEVQVMSGSQNRMIVSTVALLEARRVLKPGGSMLIGLYVDGGKSGVISFERRLKDSIKAGLELVGINRWKDHHIWHPTYKNLLKLITDNGFAIKDTYWQPQWKDIVESS